MRSTQNINVISIVPLVPPEVVRAAMPQTETANATVVIGRETIEQILAGQDPRMLIVLGPCSIHDEKAAMDYAHRLKDLREKVSDRLFLVMRVYFEKPRTTIGWKGLINDPYMDGTFDIATGIQKARRLLLDINTLGIPAGTEMLDPITPQYLADLVTWGSIGARTTESQTHRQMASGLSMPIGYKNGTDGDIQIALDAMLSAKNPHSFLGIDGGGHTCIVNTKGNHQGHLILRGGRQGPNYDEASIAKAVQRLESAGLIPNIMIDCSHANSNKDYRRQEVVFRDAIRQRLAGNRHIIGMMLESNLFEGNQPPLADWDRMKYGVSVTDACVGWEKTEELVTEAWHAFQQAQSPAPV